MLEEGKIMVGRIGWVSGAWSRRAGAIAIAACLAVSTARAAFEYPGCPDVAEGDFKMVTLVSNATDPQTTEPLKMAFDMDAQGNVDVYFTQRFGLLRKYSGANKNVVNLHKFTLATTGSSDGLTGIALDPAFKSNHYMYLFMTHSMTEWKVSRFTVNGDLLDPASEKILIKITEDGPSQHPGGSLAFDAEGNLFITVGDNNHPIYAANSNDLRGKILRIKPTPEGGYTIPAGNLFPAGTAKTRGEIYIMGSRNAYSITVDPVRKAITWGDVGPDAGKDTEEHNFATAPGNYGWPFFAGNNMRLSGGGTVEKPINTDGSNTGLQELPPAIPAINSYHQACAITGPVYYYDHSSKSKIKFPPHFNGAWFVGEFGADTVAAFALDAKGTAITARMRMFKNMKFNDPIDFQMGPDGALYVMNYAGYRTTSAVTGLLRIEYTGSCVLPVGVGNPTQASAPGVELRGASVAISSRGLHQVEVKDMAGRRISLQTGRDQANYSLSSIRNPGVYLVTVTTEQGRVSGKVVKP